MAEFKTSDVPVVKGKDGEFVAFEITNPQCKVCNLDPLIRRTVDMQLATGWRQVDVLTYLDEVASESAINHVNISTHARKHLGAKNAAANRIIASRVKQFGIDVDSVEGFLLTKQAVLDVLVHSGLENVLKGHTLVEPKDIIAAIAALTSLEEDMGANMDEMLKEFHAFSDAVKKFVPADMWDKIYDQYEKNLQDATPKALAQMTQTLNTEVIEAEASPVEEK